MANKRFIFINIGEFGRAACKRQVQNNILGEVRAGKGISAPALLRARFGTRKGRPGSGQPGQGVPSGHSDPQGSIKTRNETKTLN